MKQLNLCCHSRESGNPALAIASIRGKGLFCAKIDSLLRRGRAFSWIPAFAGMTALVVLLFAAPAFAAAPSVDPALCRALVKHTPDADVAYQSGIDVNGNAVAPADLPGQPQIKLPDQIKIPLTLNLAKTLDLNTASYPYNQLGQGTEAQLGTLTVDGDKVLFNGQQISDAQQDKLAVLCMQPR